MIAIDLGSNTIRFIEFDGFVWGNNFEKIVKTAESLYADKKIGDAALIRIIGAIEEAKKIFDFSSHEIVAYATAAMRIASNRVEIIQSLKVATGVVFTVIDAEKEAFLTLTAVLYRLKIIKSTPRKFILADIGGGSTELIQYDNGKYFSSSIN
ncbi:MAG: phosphatase, partial [Sulfuricurvum sp.]